MTMTRVERVTVRMIGRSFSYRGETPPALRRAYESNRVRFGDVGHPGALRGARSGVVGTVVALERADRLDRMRLDTARDAAGAALADEAATAFDGILELSEPGEFVFDAVGRTARSPRAREARLRAASVAVVGHVVPPSLWRARREELDRIIDAGAGASDGGDSPVVFGVPFSVGNFFVPADVEAAHRRSAALLDVALSMASAELAGELGIAGEPGWFVVSTSRLATPHAGTELVR